MASRKEYEMLFKLNAQLSSSYTGSFKSAQNPIAEMQRSIEGLNKLQSDISSYQKQQEAIEKTKGKLTTLREQYGNLQKEVETAGSASVDLKNKMLDKQQQIEKTSASLSSQTSKLVSMGDALTAAGVDTNNLKVASANLDSQINSLKADQEEAATSATNSIQNIEQALAAAGIVKGLKEIYDAFKACADASIEFESAMTGVAKTTDLSDAELKAMGEAIKDLSVDIPVITTQLGAIGEVAGQLGIADEYLLDFTTTMAMLATATTMTAEEGATMLAQFANITRMDPTQYQNLASSVVALGNNYATTEQNIVNMAQGVAASGSIAGMSEADIVALSAAVSSLGIESAAGSTSMSKLISELNTAVETGEGLSDLAAIANMSSDAFKTAWGADAASTLAAFVSGLSDVERNGKSATVVLQDLGVTEAREQRMVLSLSKSGDLLNRTLQASRSAWRENTALTDEASKRYATTESQLTMAQNAVNNFEIAIGDNLTPTLRGLLPVSTGALTGITQFIEDNPALIQAIMAAAAVFGTVTVAVTAYSAAAKIAAAASTLLSTSIPGLNVIMAVTAGVAALTAGGIALNTIIRESAYDFQALNEEFDTVTDQIADQMMIADLCDEYEQLNDELSDTTGYRKQKDGLDAQGKAIESVSDKASELDGLGDPSVTVTATLEKNGIDSAEDLQLIQDMANSITSAEGTLKQTLWLSGAEDIADGDIAKVRDMAAAVATNEGKLTQLLEVNGDVSADEVQTIKDMAAAVNTKTGTLIQYMRETGNVDEDTIALIASMAQNVDTKKGDIKQVLKVEGDVSKAEIAKIQEMAAAIKTDYGTLSQTLKASGVVTDEQISMILSLAGAISDGDGKLEQTLSLIGAENLSDADIALIKSLSASIADKEGTLSQKLDLIGFDNYDDMIKAIALADDVENANATADITIKAKQEGFDTVEEKLASIQAKMQENASALEAEKGTLSDLETKYAQLQELYNSSKKKKEKSALQEQMDELDQAIDAQKGKVDSLDEAYTRLNEEYTTTKTAADELAAKQQRLAEVKQLLIDNSGGLITATDSETEAFNEQVAVLAALTDARIAEARQKAYQGIEDQARGYVDALKDELKYQNLLDDATKQQSIAQGAVALGLDGMKAKVKQIYDEVSSKSQGLSFSDMASDEWKTYWQEQLDYASTLVNIMTGMDVDFASGGLTMLGNTLNQLDSTASVSSMEESWGKANAEVLQYQQSVLDAQGIQTTFLDNLVNGVRQGGMSLGTIETILTERFGKLQNGSAIVSNSMAYVQSALEAAAEADALVASEEQAASNSILLQEAMDAATTGVKKLSDAYNEAYDSARSSMDGQFGLFEKVGKASENIGVNTMIDRLKKQAEYMETYNDNLQKAKEAGVSDELISSLSDGSPESAQALANILATAEKSPEKIAELNAAFASVETGKDQFATTVATMETDLQTSMNNLVTTTETAIGNLDMSTDAATNAQNTVQGFIDKVDDMHDEVAAAAVALANAFNTAFKGAQGISSPSKLYKQYAQYDVQGFIGGIEDMQADAEAAMGNFAIAGLEAFSAKSQNAGLSTWGLEPESAAPLSAMRTNGDYQLQLSVSPSYSISGTSDPGSIEAVLRTHNDELREMVLDVLNEAGVDAKRKEYT